MRTWCQPYNFYDEHRNEKNKMVVPTLWPQVLAVFGTDPFFDRFRLAKRFKIWFWRGCVASVANIRKFYSAAMISGQKKMSGGNQNYFCGCSCMLRLGHRMPPRILNGNGNAVPTWCKSWTLLVFTKSCCESLWTRLTDNVAKISGNTQCVEQACVPPQSVCFVQDAVCLQQGSSQSTNPMVNFGQLKTVVVKYSHMPGTLFHAYEGPVHLPCFACLAARPTRLVPSFAFSCIWGPTRFQLFTSNLPPGLRVCTHNFGPVFLICASCWGRSNMIYPLCLPSACIQRTKKTFFTLAHKPT